MDTHKLNAPSDNISLSKNPFIWGHIVLLAAIPWLLVLSMAGLAVGDPVFPSWFEIFLLGLPAIAFVAWLQWQQPFSPFSLWVVAKPIESLSDRERRVLTLIKQQSNGWYVTGWIAISVAVLMSAIFCKIYVAAPLAQLIAPFPDWLRLFGILWAEVFFLLSNVVLQSGASALRIKLTPDSELTSLQPFAIEKIKNNFTDIAWRSTLLLKFFEDSPVFEDANDPESQKSEVSKPEVTPPEAPEAIEGISETITHDTSDEISEADRSPDSEEVETNNLISEVEADNTLEISDFSQSEQLETNALGAEESQEEISPELDIAAISEETDELKIDEIVEDHEFEALLPSSGTISETNSPEENISLSEQLESNDIEEEAQEEIISELTLDDISEPNLAVTDAIIGSESEESAQAELEAIAEISDTNLESEVKELEAQEQEPVEEAEEVLDIEDAISESNTEDIVHQVDTDSPEIIEISELAIESSRQFETELIFEINDDDLEDAITEEDEEDVSESIVELEIEVVLDLADASSESITENDNEVEVVVDLMIVVPEESEFETMSEDSSNDEETKVSEISEEICLEESVVEAVANRIQKASDRATNFSKKSRKSGFAHKIYGFGKSVKENAETSISSSEIDAPTEQDVSDIKLQDLDNKLEEQATFNTYVEKVIQEYLEDPIEQVEEVEDIIEIAAVSEQATEIAEEVLTAEESLTTSTPEEIATPSILDLESTAEANIAPNVETIADNILAIKTEVEEASESLSTIETEEDDKSHQNLVEELLVDKFLARIEELNIADKANKVAAEDQIKEANLKNDEFADLEALIDGKPLPENLE
ncbi:MAG: hypothetical protein DCF19_12060 [Pseudanabaena frigida]|uniref:Low-complexity tail membrane protein n=1 Tax=Pseudanabaena frigida TaxID=945775 RepID=A0A2W4W788_9CYAN|nr:MAG: hypothetical protein DCF19_12060 [Pseudanabaena frigida]